MREMPTQPRIRGAEQGALMVSAPRFVNTTGNRPAPEGETL